jgi:hypothetical protein
MQSESVLASGMTIYIMMIASELLFPSIQMDFWDLCLSVQTLKETNPDCGATPTNTVIGEDPMRLPTTMPAPSLQ